MQPSEKPAFVGLITDAMAFYRQDVSPFALGVWWSACERFGLEQVSTALTRHAMDPERGQFAPKPADLVRMLQGTATDRAMLAWGKALQAMQSVGAYTDVVFDDAAIHAVVDDLGGWVKICRGDLKELSYLQHRFCEAYRAYAGRGSFEYPRRLVGDRSPDSDYFRVGRKAPRPAVVGDTEQARLVYEGGQRGGKVTISYSPFSAAIEAVSARAIEVHSLGRH